MRWVAVSSQHAAQLNVLNRFQKIIYGVYRVPGGQFHFIQAQVRNLSVRSRVIYNAEVFCIQRKKLIMLCIRFVQPHVPGFRKISLLPVSVPAGKHMVSRHQVNFAVIGHKKAGSLNDAIRFNRRKYITI